MTEVATFTGNKIQTQIYAYLVKYPKENPHIVKNKLVENLGVNPFTVERWLSNKTQPDLPQAYRIAQTLECSIDDLVN